MWRLFMLLSCLVAAAAGTPLRQAEAADDLARYFAEADDEYDVEDVDGGVGDDAGETVLDRGAAAHAPAEAMTPATAFLPPDAVATIGPGEARGPVVDASPPSEHARRFARLQRFLF